MVLLAISIGWKVVVLTLGSAVPRWVIGSGVDHIPLASRAYAEEAKITALSLWNHPLERLGIVRAVRVTRVDSVTSPEADGKTTVRSGAAAQECRARSATVVAYTYFAIPYSQARTACKTGVVEYRVFKRRS